MDKTRDMLVVMGLYTYMLPSHKSTPTVLPVRPEVLEVPVREWEYAVSIRVPWPPRIDLMKLLRILLPVPVEDR